MPSVVEASVEIPKRAFFKPAEVCEIASVQPYVLRSWESEFPDLGVVKASSGLRMYRRSDVERVLRIKQLVFGDGLTLAGVRRRIEEEAAPVAAETPLEELLGQHARERLAEVKKGLRGILQLLGRPMPVAVAQTPPFVASAIKPRKASPVRAAAARTAKRNHGAPRKRLVSAGTRSSGRR